LVMFSLQPVAWSIDKIVGDKAAARFVQL